MWLGTGSSGDDGGDGGGSGSGSDGIKCLGGGGPDEFAGGEGGELSKNFSCLEAPTRLHTVAIRAKIRASATHLPLLIFATDTRMTLL